MDKVELVMKKAVSSSTVAANLSDLTGHWLTTADLAGRYYRPFKKFAFHRF